MSFEYSSSMAYLTFFFLGVNRSGLGEIQQPIKNFTRPWDDFMVHGINNAWEAIMFWVPRFSDLMENCKSNGYMNVSLTL